MPNTYGSDMSAATQANMMSPQPPVSMKTSVGKAIGGLKVGRPRMPVGNLKTTMRKNLKRDLIKRM